MVNNESQFCFLNEIMDDTETIQVVTEKDGSKCKEEALASLLSG